mmetsp:Transcript_9455/g.38300  ORF Transcript_9455/g.38300 Transcript_9455/m.38300 type:complete len:186 (-) Transcript_9455:131-688(-)
MPRKMPKQSKMPLMLLVVLLCCPRPSRANEGDKKFQLQAVLCSTPEWSLLETLVTAPLVGSYNVQNSSPLQKLLSRFIPVSGTLEYTCSDGSNDEDSGKMTVDAFLQMDDSTAPMNTLRYSAFAQLANSSTVVHRVHTSTHSDYIGKTLVRDIEFHKDTSKLVLTPREKFLGAAFALVWIPSSLS